MLKNLMHFATAVGAALALTTSTAHAFTVSAQGIVGNGSSKTNYFQIGTGTGNTDLTNQAFTLSITNDPATLALQGYDPEIIYASDLSAAFQATLTINGISATIDIPSGAYSYSKISSIFDPLTNTTTSTIYQLGFLKSEVAYIYLDGTQSALQPSLDFNQVYSYNTVASDNLAAFFGNDDLQIVALPSFGYGYIGNISLNGGYQVPEPASLALTALGLSSLAGLRRKAPRKA